MYRILLITAALIAYGSLWPWQYNPAHATGSPPSILFHSWPGKITASDIKDIVVNLLLYLPIGMFGYLALDRHRHRRLRVIGPIAFGFVLSCCIEMVQIFDLTRNCSALDVVCNTTSSGVGVFLGFVFRESLSANLLRSRAAQRRQAAGPLLLLYVWVGFQTIPLFPLTTHIGPKLRIVASSQFFLLDCLASFIAWLIVGRLLDAIYSRKVAWRMLLLVSVLAPAKIFIAHRTPTISEIVGVLAAIVTYAIMNRNTTIVERSLPAFVLLLLLVRGLAPFHFVVHNRFTWTPFVPLLHAEWENGLIVLCEKCFWYGAAIWLLWATRHRLLTSTALVASLLAVVEILQVRLPGRTAESTDPLLAIMLGAILWLLERHSLRIAVRLAKPDLVQVNP